MGSPSISSDPVDTPDISVRKLLKHGDGPAETGEGPFSGEVEISAAWFFGLPLPLLSPDSELRLPPETFFSRRLSDFLFLLRLKLPLSNIFSQLGSRVQ